MKKTILILAFPLICCDLKPAHYAPRHAVAEEDGQELTAMISAREKAMIAKNIAPVMKQFADDATWINSQGYLFEGKEVIEKFHIMLFNNDSLDYEYVAGKPRIRILDDRNALVYYGWQMNWVARNDRADTTKREIGLMTLTAQKVDTTWQWRAVTNQYTPWYYEKLDAVFIE
jgi:uncharacterized protein (TIGR02246 family)